MRRQDRLGHCPRYWRSLPRETRCYHCHVPPVTVDEDLREMRRV
jgi:hypothetical protein